MVSLPREFVATKVPGYWKYQAYGKNTYHDFDGYWVSHKGKRKKLHLDYLMDLEEADSEIEIFNGKYAP